ncbi:MULTISPECIES: ABC-2 family transporter protein [unclassified Ruminococcus]|uniref:ABC transporter permease n=1 Tax=unclassified Ruminococcus TaxID=2608920 RepID=UPI002108678A|nr:MULTISPECIES: ABC-2 family transporter protein [unclassified Ruminococcus]
MNTYIQFAAIKFRNNMAYRFEYLMGILNTVLNFIVYCCIYKALYGGANEVDGITFSMVTTNFIISLGLTNAFSKNEMFLQDKIKQGTIANELLKPVNFKFRMLFEDMGDGLFKVIFNFIPAVLIAMVFTQIQPPAGILNFTLCLVSAVLGYIVLWYISFIVQTWSFWLFSVWGIVTIKNVIINICSGALLPLWFMPEPIMNIIRFTPFDSIFFTPVQLYLGNLQGCEILFNFARQLLWIVILYFAGEFFWRRGIKKLVVQGG